MITGYFLDVSPLSDEIYPKLLAKVNNIQMETISRTLPYSEHNLKLLGKLLLYKLLSANNLQQHLLIAEQHTSEFGKPYFENSNFDYNIAHSGDIIFCAGVQAARLGVDIEKEEDRDVTAMQAYFCQKEWDLITGSKNSKAEFYKIWVRKESLVKATGKGVFQPLQEIDVSDNEVILDGIRWFLQDVFIKPGYTCCVAANRKMEIVVEEVDFNKLLLI